MGVDEINIPIHETNNSPSGERVSRLSQIVRPRVWFQQIVVTEEYHLHSRLCCNIDKHSSSRRVRWNIFISQSKDAKCLFAYVDGKNFSFILLMRFFPPQPTLVRPHISVSYSRPNKLSSLRRTVLRHFWKAPASEQTNRRQTDES